MMQRILLTAISLQLALYSDQANGRDEASVESLIDTIRDGESDDREYALRKIKDLKPLSDSDRQELFAVFTDRRQPSKVRVDVIQTYFDIFGPPVQNKPLLIPIAQAKSEPMDVRVWAMIGLMTGADHDVKHIKPIRVCLAILKDRSEAPKVRQHAVAAIYQLPSLAEESLEVAYNVLLDRTEPTDLRMAVLQALPAYTHIYPRAYDDLSSKVLQLSKDEKESIHLRVQALDTFSDISFSAFLSGRYSKKSSEQYSRDLFMLFSSPNGNSRVRDGSGWALRSLYFIDKKLIPRLIEILRGDDGFIHAHAATALAKFGGSDTSAVPALIEVWKDDKEPSDARKAAAEALLKIDPDRAKSLGIEEQK